MTRRWLTSWLVDQVPRDHWEPDAVYQRRRRVVATTAVAGAGLLGLSLSSEPDSPAFYAATASAAAVWTVGGLRSGPLHLGWIRAGDASYRRPVGVPILIGAGAFAAFYGAALVAREVPLLDRALTDVLRYAHEGSSSLVVPITLANGLAEEIFFRGAGYAAAGAAHPVAKTTAGYVLATCATRNPALVLASAAMGTLFALQRRASGGIQGPMITHLTWSALMVRYLPPLFRDRPSPARSARRPPA